MRKWYPETGEEIDGSKVLFYEDDGEFGTLATVADGRQFYWEDQSYRVEPGTPSIPDGEWKEYRGSYEPEPWKEDHL